MISINSRELSLVEIAREKELWKEPTWLSLLYYQKNWIGEGYKSIVSSETFFVSNEGRMNPKDELLETIKAYQASLEENPDQHVSCRFPARVNWLQMKLGQSLPIKNNCREYLDFKTQNQIKELFLVFASEDLTSPFGEVMLRFFNQDGASLIRFKRSLISGFFTHPHFFYLKNDNPEKKDLWEYPLLLTKNQKKLLRDHLWEILGVKFSSAYLSFGFSELIEIVLDKKLSFKWRFFSLPYHLLEKLEKQSLLGIPFLNESKQSVFQSHFLALSEEKKGLVERMTEFTVPTDQEEYKKQTPKDKAIVLEVLDTYYDFLVSKYPENEHYELKKKYLRKNESSLPAANLSLKEIQKVDPLKAQRHTRLSLGFVDSKKLGSGARLHIRGAYDDLLSPYAGKDRGREFHLFNMKLNSTSKKTWLESLDFVSITSLNLSETGQRGDGGMAWNGKLSLGEKDERCLSCLSLRGEGGLGRAWILFKGAIFYNFLNLRLQTSNTYDENFAFVPKGGLLFNFSDWVRIDSSFSHRFFVDGAKNDHQEFSFKGRFGKSKYWDGALEFAESFEKRFSASFSYYF